MPDSTFTPFATLRTERLTLRRLLLSDNKEIFAIRSDPEMNKYIDREPATNIQDARNFIHRITEDVGQNELFYWAVTLNGNDTLIGTVCYFHFSENREKAEIGYELLPAFQGKGIMMEAVQKVVAFGFQNLRLITIEAETQPENERSVILLEKLGFKKEVNTDKAENKFTVFKLTNS